MSTAMMVTVRNSDRVWAARLQYSSDTASVSYRNETTMKMSPTSPPGAPPETAVKVFHMASPLVSVASGRPAGRRLVVANSCWPTGVGLTRSVTWSRAIRPVACPSACHGGGRPAGDAYFDSTRPIGSGPLSRAATASAHALSSG